MANDVDSRIVQRLQVVRGAVLNPRGPGAIDYWADGGIVGDAQGRIVAAGPWSEIASRFDTPAHDVRQADGIIMPSLLDAHIHVPQHPIRGHFLDGVAADSPDGPLLAGLARNVFPAEGRFANSETARQVIEQFRADTLAHGVVGGSTFMTVHVTAAREALRLLPDTWSIGLVLMQRNCPEYLRTAEATLDDGVADMANEFGRRLIVTDRFAGAVDSPLRRRGAALASRFNLRMQTHLNEQRAEKAWIESLYPDAANYTDVYRRDGLLDRAAIMAHCIYMHPEEFDMLATAAPRGAAVAHCPVSNTLLGSGVMPLAELAARDIPYAICTDVGASPTTSLLCEMLHFLRVHQGRSSLATPREALYRTTLAPAKILELDHRLGSFKPGKEFSFIEVVTDGKSGATHPTGDVDQVILERVLGSNVDELAGYAPGGAFGRYIDELIATGLDIGPHLAMLTAEVGTIAARLDKKVVRVTLAGQVVWKRQ